MKNESSMLVKGRESRNGFGKGGGERERERATG